MGIAAWIEFYGTHSTDAKNSDNRNWRLHNKGARLNPAAGSSDEWGSLTGLPVPGDGVASP